MLLVPCVERRPIDRQGVMKMGYDGDVPRVASHRARDKGVKVFDKVRDDDLQEFVGKPCNWGGMWSGRFFGSPVDEPRDFGLASVPQPNRQ